MTTQSPFAGSDLQPITLAAPPVAGSTHWRAHVYAHTHWDREWYRSFERFRMQLVGVVDRIVQVLDSDPSFTTFVLDGQTIVLEDYLAIRPEEEPRLRRLVGAGRLEIGPWHVLPDEFLVSGESLVRNLLEGRRVAARFGTPVPVGYLPDPFGHIAQLPAILRGFGIDNVIFSRGIGDDHERLGTEFRWESLDGSTSVLALVQASPYTSGYCNAELLARGNDAADDEGYARVLELAPHLARSVHTDALLLAAGCDHETMQEQLPRIVARINELLPDCDVRITGLDAYVASVREAVGRLEKAGGGLERYRGELRGSRFAPILASIFSARIPIKQQNDAVQALLERHVEPLMAAAVLAGVRPRRDVEPFLRHAWRLVLENHPHDSIGGCSIDEVHLEMPARTLRAQATALGLVEDLRIALGMGGVAVVHDATGRGGIAERTDGTPVALRGAHPGRLVELDAVVVEDDENAAVRVIDGACVQAGLLRAEVVEGALYVAFGEQRTRLDWIDEADAGDEYDFGAVTDDAPLVAEVRSVATRIAGPGVAELAVTHRLDLPMGLTEDRSRRTHATTAHDIVTCVRVSKASPLAQLVVRIDNHASDHRLRLRASVDGLASDDMVAALGHFAIIERPARPSQPCNEWRQQPPGLDHCAGAVRVRDVLLAGRGIHEYEARDEGLELTVLRSIGWLSRDDVAGRPGHAGPALPTPAAQCHGPIRLDLAVGVGATASFDAARDFLAPPLLLEAFGVGESQQPKATGLEPVPLESGAMARARDVLGCTPKAAAMRIEVLGLEIGGEHVVPSACKLADDGSGDLIVRWWAPTKCAGTPIARMRIAAPIRDAWRARLDETKLGPAPMVDGQCEMRLEPGSIATLRIAPAPASTAE